MSGCDPVAEFRWTLLVSFAVIGSAQAIIASGLFEWIGSKGHTGSVMKTASALWVRVLFAAA